MLFRVGLSLEHVKHSLGDEEPAAILTDDSRTANEASSCGKL
jgi:hypothetical protein